MNGNAAYPSQIEGLPITPRLDEICGRLKAAKARSLVLTAETAAGKSTALPLALLRHFGGKIVMLEPRRLAAVAVASRVAELLGEEPGGTAGWRLHLDSRVSARTRLEVVTEAILTRRLQRDPLLDGVSVVVLDEFHERSLNADLALAFLSETMEARDDLFLVVMSATMDSRAAADFLGAETIHVEGRLFPVKIEHRPGETVEKCVRSLVQESTASALSGKTEGKSDDQTVVFPQFIHENVDNLWTTCGKPVENVENGSKNVDKPTGKERSPLPRKGSFRADTILAFLPGIRELSRAKRTLSEELGERAEVLVLHSSVPLAEQRAALAPVPESSPRRVILASAIAETSLTVPGVSVVVDSGLCRVSRLRPSLGMERLVTERESGFSAEQRAGRAGRTASGRAIRLWGRGDARPGKSPPEIVRADLSQLVLECAAWGVRDAAKLRWLDPPPRPAWDSAAALLRTLGCIGRDGSATETGLAALSLGLHPRLACAALSAENAVPVVMRFSEFADASPERQRKFADDLSRRISRTGIRPGGRKSTAEILLAGFPDRLARRTERGDNYTEYQFPSGRKARLSRTNGAEWIVAPEVDAGAAVGTVRESEDVPEETALSWLAERSEASVRLSFDERTGRIEKSGVESFGEIVVRERRLQPTAEDFSAAVCQTVARRGISWLPLSKSAESLLVRAEFRAANAPDEELSRKIGSLADSAGEWLAPFLSGGRLTERAVEDALGWRLDAGRIDRDVPREIALPNGRRRRLAYERIGGEVRPVLECVIQQLFGVFETPRVMGRRVLLRLLSPARRPLQVTDDLEHFWSGTWTEICREMRGRYPKHNWDYRVAEE